MYQLVIYVIHGVSGSLIVYSTVGCGAIVPYYSFNNMFQQQSVEGN
jgi:hypothetical protein